MEDTTAHNKLELPIIISLIMVMGVYLLFKKPKITSSGTTSNSTVPGNTNIVYSNGYELTPTGLLTDANGNTIQSNVGSYDPVSGIVTYINGYTLSGSGVLSGGTGKVVTSFVSSYNPTTDAITFMDSYTLNEDGTLYDANGNEIAANVSNVDSTGTIFYQNGYSLSSTGNLYDNKNNLVSKNVSDYISDTEFSEYTIPFVGTFGKGSTIVYSDGTKLTYLLGANATVNDGFITNPLGAITVISGAINYSPVNGIITFSNGYTLSKGVLINGAGKSLGQTNVIGFLQPYIFYNNGYYLNVSTNTLYNGSGGIVDTSVASYNVDGSITYTNNFKLSALGVLSNPSGITIANNVKSYCFDASETSIPHVIFTSGYMLPTVANLSVKNNVVSNFFSTTSGTLENFDASGNWKINITGNLFPITSTGAQATYTWSAGGGTMNVPSIYVIGTYNVGPNGGIQPLYLDTATGNLYMFMLLGNIPFLSGTALVSGWGYLKPGGSYSFAAQ